MREEGRERERRREEGRKGGRERGWERGRRENECNHTSVASYTVKMHTYTCMYSHYRAPSLGKSNTRTHMHTMRTITVKQYFDLLTVMQS